LPGPFLVAHGVGGIPYVLRMDSVSRCIPSLACFTVTLPVQSMESRRRLMSLRVSASSVQYPTIPPYTETDEPPAPPPCAMTSPPAVWMTVLVLPDWTGPNAARVRGSTARGFGAPSCSNVSP
jgi:hypothetical protein